MQLDVVSNLNELTLDVISTMYNDTLNAHPTYTLGQQMRAIQQIALRCDKKLTNEQLLFACASGPPILCDAGPGSGKTLAAEWGNVAKGIFFKIPMHQMLMCVYTKQASVELTKRVQATIDRVNHLGVEGVLLEGYPTISTVHALARVWVKEYSNLLGFTGIMIENGLIDDVQQVFEDIMEELDEVKYLMLSNHERRQVVSFYNYVTELDMKWETMDEAEICANRFYPAKTMDWNYLKRIFMEYLDYKLVHIKFDFTDFLVKFYKLLQENSFVRERLAVNYQSVKIDEYQDSSSIFIKIFQLITAEHNNLKCVGDTDQALFNWRGGDTQNMLAFKEHFPTGKVLTLTLNMRCPASIVNVSNNVIAHNKLRYDKSLVGLEKPHSYKISKYSTRSDMIDMIMNSLDKIPPSELHDTVICFRNSRSSAYISTYMQLKTNYRYQVLSGMRPFNDSLSKALIPLLNLPHGSHKQFLPLLYKYTPMTKEDSVYAYERHNTLEEVRDASEKPEVVKAINTLIKYCSDVRNNSKATCLLPVYNAIKAYYLNYVDRLRLESGDTLDSELYLLIVEFFIDSTRTTQSIRSDISDIFQASDAHNAVKLSTIHGLKGAEFKHVIMMDVDHTFPNLSMAQRLLDDEAHFIEYIEEETRVLYVGLTRTAYSLEIFAKNSAFLDMLDPAGHMDVKQDALAFMGCVNEFVPVEHVSKPSILVLPDLEQVADPIGDKLMALLSGYNKRG